MDPHTTGPFEKENTSATHGGIYVDLTMLVMEEKIEKGDESGSRGGDLYGGGLKHPKKRLWLKILSQAPTPLQGRLFSSGLTEDRSTCL